MHVLTVKSKENVVNRAQIFSKTSTTIDNARTMESVRDRGWGWGWVVIGNYLRGYTLMSSHSPVLEMNANPISMCLGEAAGASRPGSRLPESQGRARIGQVDSSLTIEG